MSVRLSIVIPFYKVEKYISQCLDSVFDQDIDEAEYEVICVNDCSPDRSREIVLKYQEKHANLKLVEHQENKMLGAARNTGLLMAKGEYVWFVDSDDYIEKSVLNDLLNIATKNNLDILKFNVSRFDENNILPDYVNFPIEIGVMSGLEYCELYLLKYWSLFTWSKIYKRKFLIDNNLFCPEGVFFEDNFHSIKAYFLAERFSYFNKVAYFYRINPDSIMTSKNLWGPRKLADRFHYNYDSIKFIDQFDKGIKPEFKKKLIYSYTWALDKYRKVILFYSFNHLIEFYRYLGNVDKVLLSKHMSRKVYYFYTQRNLIICLLMLLKPVLFILSMFKKVKNVFR